jgi:hypothetical protein
MKLKALAATVIAAMIPASALAHHSFGMFDLQKSVTFVGTVTEYDWENPHTHIIINVTPGPGVDPSTLGVWDIEGGAVNIMTRFGWNRSVYKVGDKATIVAHPMKNGSKGASLFYAEFPDGHKLYNDIPRPGAS